MVCEVERFSRRFDEDPTDLSVGKRKKTRRSVDFSMKYFSMKRCVCVCVCVCPLVCACVCSRTHVCVLVCEHTCV